MNTFYIELCMVPVSKCVFYEKHLFKLGSERVEGCNTVIEILIMGFSP